MNDLIERIVNAIIRQEGMPPDCFNPGNLRAAPWRPHPTITNGFWVPASREEGIAGAAHEVALRIARGESLLELISAWAPASDNNKTAQYVENVQQWAQIQNKNVTLWNYLGVD